MWEGKSANRVQPQFVLIFDQDMLPPDDRPFPGGLYLRPSQHMHSWLHNRSQLHWF